MTYFYGHEINVEIYVDVVNKSVIFYIRMKTANDFNKHLEEFRSDMSADNILQAAVLRKGLVMYLYTNDANKSISETANKVASLQAGAFVNMNALQRSIQRFTDTMKTMKKHVDRNWDAMIKLLDEQFILPIQTLSAPHTSTSLCPVVDKPSSSCCSISWKLRTHCERYLHRQLKLKEILISKQLLKRKFQTILNKKHDNRKQQQALCRKLRIERNLRSQLRDLKKKMAQKDAAIKHLKNENSSLKQINK